LPWKPPIHRPPGWQRAKRARTDALDRAYGTQAWRKLAAAVIVRDRGICHLCGQPGADTGHHLVEKRRGGTDDPANLRAVHRGCHNRAHGGRGFFHKQEPCLRPALGFAYPWPK
jgi:5-methylcytosine-specific restriction endonuclease McrA